MSDIEQTAKQALEHHQAGELEQGERLYRKVLQTEPRHGDVNHNLGVLLIHTGKPGAALPYLKAAIEINPTKGQYWLSYAEGLLASGNGRDAMIIIDEAKRRGLAGTEVDALRKQVAASLRPGPDQSDVNELVALFSSGRHTEAEALARQMIQFWPNHGFGWKVLGTVLAARQRFAEALPVIQRTLALLPLDPDSHNNLGVALRAGGRLAEAESSYRRVLELNPIHHEANNNLGNALQALGRLAEAEASYRRALEINPDFDRAQCNLGNIQRELGRLAEAEASYRRVLELRPNDSSAHYNLGCILQDLGRLAEAEASYRRALELEPDNCSALVDLGNALRALGRLSEAEASYRHALELKPDLHEAHNNLGMTLQAFGRNSEAEASFRRALEPEPDSQVVHNNLGNVLQLLGRLSEAEARYRRVLQLNPDFHEVRSNLIFTICYQPDQPPTALTDEAKKFGGIVAAKARPYTSWLVTPNPSRRLRIGMVSADLRQHSVSYFLESFLAQLSGERIELYAYQTQGKTDAVTERLKPLFAAWKTVVEMNDEQLARTIHADAVDILIDLSGHTSNNRLPVYAWKPAPVQFTWLGHCVTTGVPGMDYILGDPYCTPPEDASHFSETIWQLPETNCCFTPPEFPLEVAPLPALRDGSVTFGSFNNLIKLNDAVVAVWAKVLTAVPGSKLFLKARQLIDAAVCENTLRRFAACGIAADRLLLEGPSPREAMLRDYARVDIALDPFPIQGGTVSVEALWMGVPVLTRRGDRYLGRFGEMIANNTPLSDWIAPDNEGYVELAVSRAADLNRLSQLRADLRAQVLVSPLFDAPRFARHFEDALRGMWRKWCDQQ